MRSLKHFPLTWRSQYANDNWLEQLCDLTQSRRAQAIWLLPAIVAFAVLAGCNRSTPPAQPPAVPSPATVPAPAPAPTAVAPAPATPAIPPGTEVPVSSVDSVMLNRAPDSPDALVIDVTGTLPSGGWTNPRLVQDTTETADRSVRVYKFVATSPDQTPANQMPQMLAAELRIDSLPAEVKTVRVVSAGNQISAPVTE
ncbi:MAG TPA: hypothetical protein VFW28_19425 [Micropepsaceae bacterium]|nr:hypothetical protein [Micropepsaceae bacterium]